MFMGVKTLHQLDSKKHHDTSNNVLNSIIVNDTFAPMRRGSGLDMSLTKNTTTFTFAHDLPVAVF